MRQHVGQWFCAALWLVPLLGLCGWIGAAALPSFGARETAGVLCSAAASALRTARSGSAPLREARVGPVDTLPGMPPVPDPSNVYSAVAAGLFSPAVNGTPARIYVPNLRSNDVYAVSYTHLTLPTTPYV